MEKINVICEFYNDYDQHGGYFTMVTCKSKEELEQEGWVFGRTVPYKQCQSWYTFNPIEPEVLYEFEDQDNFEALTKIIEDKK